MLTWSEMVFGLRSCCGCDRTDDDFDDRSEGEVRDGFPYEG